MCRARRLCGTGLDCILQQLIREVSFHTYTHAAVLLFVAVVDAAVAVAAAVDDDNDGGVLLHMNQSVRMNAVPPISERVEGAWLARTALVGGRGVSLGDLERGMEGSAATT